MFDDGRIIHEIKIPHSSIQEDTGHNENNGLILTEMFSRSAHVQQVYKPIFYFLCKFIHLSCAAAVASPSGKLNKSTRQTRSTHENRERGGGGGKWVTSLFQKKKKRKMGRWEDGEQF